MRLLKNSIAILVLLLFVMQSNANDKEQDAIKDRPVIGLVLSGGGARGASHIGVLKILEELRAPVDIITGTSMGAIIGGLYAYGYSPQEMEKFLTDVDWDEVFIDKPQRSQLNYRRKQDDSNFLIKLESGLKNGKLVMPTGLVQGQKLNLLLKSLTLSAPENFDSLPIRFRAVAADIETGEAVIIDKGGLATAMRASLSIPGIFAPVEWSGRLLVDGGFANTIPVQLARDLGADILIVVDLSSEPLKRGDLSSPFSILNQTLGFQILHNSVEQLNTLKLADILIQPDMGKYSSTDFKYSAEMVTKGVLATELKAQQLKQHAMSENEYEAYQLSIYQKHENLPRIDNIVIQNNSTLGNNILKSQITTESGIELNLQNLELDLSKLYGLNIFKNIDYKIEQTAKESNLIIKAEEKDWGPNYIRFGMNLESDFDGLSEFNIAASHTSIPINSSAGEWRSELQFGHDQLLSTELYQPLDDRLLYYIATKASYSETHFERYESGRKMADYIISSSQFEIAAGRQFGNWGALGISLNTGSGDASPYIGDLFASRSDFGSGYWSVGFAYDQLDNLNFPKNGALSNINWVSTRKDLGADVEQDRLSISYLNAKTWDKNTLLFWTGLGSIINTEEPTQSGFSIGGFFSLSGFENSELIGSNAAVMRLIYLREISGSQSALKMPVYLGGSLEAGNVWNDRDDIHFNSLLSAGSLSIAIDTPLGPLYLARGFAQGGRSKFYLFLGRSFTFF